MQNNNSEFVESFNSEEEKKKFIDYTINDFNRNRIRIRRDTIKEFKSIVFNENGMDPDYSFINCVIDTGVGAILLAAFGVMSLPALAGVATFGVIDSSIVGSTGYKYRGILPLLLGIVMTPMVFLGKTIDKIEQEGNYKDKLKKIKDIPIVPKAEAKEETKEIKKEEEKKPQTEEEMIKAINKSMSNWDVFLHTEKEQESLCDVLSKIRGLMNGISQIYNEDVRLDCYKKLSAVCDSFERSRKLTGQQLISSNDFVMSQLKPIGKFLTYKLTFDNISPEIEAEVEEMVRRMRANKNKNLGD